jgi:hypothetical protein
MKGLMRRAVIGSVLVAVLSGVAVQPAQAAPTTTRAAVSASTVAQSAQAGAMGAVAVAPTGTTTAASTVPGDVGAQRIPIGPILTILRRLSAAAYNAILNAVRAGWAAFQRAWNNLPKAIRWALGALGTQWDIYKALACWLGITC